LNLWYSQTAYWMISGGNRWRLYIDFASFMGQLLLRAS
jgi:hypothetical protein